MPFGQLLKIVVYDQANSNDSVTLSLTPIVPPIRLWGGCLVVVIVGWVEGPFFYLFKYYFIYISPSPPSPFLLLPLTLSCVFGQVVGRSAVYILLAHNRGETKAPRRRRKNKEILSFHRPITISFALTYFNSIWFLLSNRRKIKTLLHQSRLNFFLFNFLTSCGRRR